MGQSEFVQNKNIMITGNDFSKTIYYTFIYVLSADLQYLLKYFFCSTIALGNKIFSCLLFIEI